MLSSNMGGGGDDPGLCHKSYSMHHDNVVVSVFGFFTEDIIWRLFSKILIKLETKSTPTLPIGINSQV